MSNNINKYIGKITINNKIYSLKCEIVETHPINCYQCGALLQLKYGEGQCMHCGTYYTTHYYIEEQE